MAESPGYERVKPNGTVEVVVGPRKEGQHEHYQYPHKVTIQIDEPLDAQNQRTVPKSP